MYTVVVLIREIEYEVNEIVGIFTTRDKAIQGFLEHMTRYNPYRSHGVDLTDNIQKLSQLFQDGKDRGQLYRDIHYMLESYQLDQSHL